MDRGRSKTGVGRIAKADGRYRLHINAQVYLTHEYRTCNVERKSVLSTRACKLLIVDRISVQVIRRTSFAWFQPLILVEGKSPYCVHIQVGHYMVPLDKIPPVCYGLGCTTAQT